MALTGRDRVYMYRRPEWELVRYQVKEKPHWWPHPQGPLHAKRKVKEQKMICHVGPCQTMTANKNQMTLPIGD